MRSGISRRNFVGVSRFGSRHARATVAAALAMACVSTALVILIVPPEGMDGRAMPFGRASSFLTGT